VTMNGAVQDNRNSLTHREVRYGENARFDGVRKNPGTPYGFFLTQVERGWIVVPWQDSLEWLFPGCRTT